MSRSYLGLLAYTERDNLITNSYLESDYYNVRFVQTIKLLINGSTVSPKF
jgi:hypothetical protein